VPYPPQSPQPPSLFAKGEGGGLAMLLLGPERRCAAPTPIPPNPLSPLRTGKGELHAWGNPGGGVLAEIVPAPPCEPLRKGKGGTVVRTRDPRRRHPCPRWCETSPCPPCTGEGLLLPLRKGERGWEIGVGAGQRRSGLASHLAKATLVRFAKGKGGACLPHGATHQKASLPTMVRPPCQRPEEKNSALAAHRLAGLVGADHRGVQAEISSARIRGRRDW
jgi:hypothetical protein